MKIVKILIFTLFLNTCIAQTFKLEWTEPMTSLDNSGALSRNLSFKNASTPDTAYKVSPFIIRKDFDVADVSFSAITYEVANADEESILGSKIKNTTIKYELFKTTSRGNVSSFVSMIPLIKGKDGKTYKVKSFKLNFTKNTLKVATNNTKIISTDDSPLATGKIQKVSVIESGIYKLDYSYLNNLGFTVSSLNPKNFHLYGFGGMLPELNSDNRFYDVPEVSLYFSGNDDDKFDANEYFLAYLEGANKISNNGYTYPDIKTNLYADKVYYFIKFDNNVGKRIQQTSTNFNTFESSVSTYNYVYRHEVENVNLLASGRDWLGESLVTTPLQTFNIFLPNLEENSEVVINGVVQGANIASSTCTITTGNKTANYTLNAASNYDKVRYFNFYHSILSSDISNNILPVTFKYNSTQVSYKTHIDYFQVNASALLELNQDQLLFRNNSVIDQGKVQFELSTQKSNVEIWDVTLVDQIVRMNTSSATNVLTYIDSLSSPKEYVAVNVSGSFYSPTNEGSFTNQNLHGLATPDLLIITNSTLKQAADSLADFRRTNEKYDVEVVTLDKIYNEFSSGKQDLSAIRNFVKYLYSKNSTKLKYVLLLGACSFDYKDRISNNTNLVPVYETPNTYNQILSYSSDDYIGMLDEDEGNGLERASMEVSVGRLPVRDLSEALSVVTKLKHYANNSKNYGKWKNEITLTCDDDDTNLHMYDAEYISEILVNKNSALKINKYYLNLYPEESTPTGQESPVLHNKLISKINSGTMVLNYSGHGREIGLAGENIIMVEEISKLVNYDRLFLFIAATCEFGRYDDPEVFSGLQGAILNAKGGSIATIGATRPVYQSDNRQFNGFLSNIFYDKVNGKHYTLGELTMLSKNATNNGANRSVINYALLGDPSMRLAYPEEQVVITKVTDENENLVDTVKALSKTIIYGQVENDGVVDTAFNGKATITFYDKESVKKTKYDAESNSGVSQDLVIVDVNVRESVIYQGNADVKKGLFKTEFVVPKDISYLVGSGLILTYAQNEDFSKDACGGDIDVLIGSSKTDVVFENVPPVAELFMNDTNFVNGGSVLRNANFIAKVYDDNGINLSQSSVGHQITLTLDGDVENQYILNDYYSSNGSFQKGIIEFPLTDLSVGKHTAEFTIWDVFNNSTTQKLDFEVSKNDIQILSLNSYPTPDGDYRLIDFTHNRAGENLNANLEIFDLQGRRVLEIESAIDRAESNVKDMNWLVKYNGLYNMNNTIYVYRLTLTSEFDGSSTSKTQKLVFIK